MCDYLVIHDQVTYVLGCVCVCVCVCVCGELCGLVVKAVDWQPKGARFNPHQPPLEKKRSSPLAPYPGPRKIVNWEPGLGWGWTRPLAVLIPLRSRWDFGCPHHSWRAQSVLLRVLGPASGVCLVLAQSSLK